MRKMMNQPVSALYFAYVYFYGFGLPDADGVA